MAKRTPAEEFESAQRQAEDALAHEPEPAPPYLTGSLEEDERREDAAAQAAALALDQESDRSDRDRILRLEEVLAEQAKTLRTICEAIMGKKVENPLGFSAPEEEPPMPRNVAPNDTMRPVKFILIPSEDPHQNRPQPVNLNGHQWIIPRGEVVTAPWAIMEILRTAVIDSYEYPIEGGQYLGIKRSAEPMTLSEPVYRPQRRFQLQIVEGA